EGVKDNRDLDPLFKSLLKHHWLEESQHTKLDTLIVEELAAQAAEEEIDRAFKEYAEIGAFIDQGIGRQTALNVDSFIQASGKKLSHREREQMEQALLQGMRWTYLGTGMTHRNFLDTVQSIKPAARAEIERRAPVFCRKRTEKKGEGKIMAIQTSLSAEPLKRAIKGSVLSAGDAGYDEARQIWNAMIDRRPALIVRCAEAADVPAAIDFARRNRLEISIRGAGHNIAGNALCDGGLTIDFADMKKVQVDAAKKRASVEPGATLADLDEATQAHGLATPVGINSTTGVAGLTLGGGFGWLTRKYGMTIDNLISVEIVTAQGKRLRASESENADLFWAIRGGGGNFGVVTRFEFQLHSVGPEIFAGLLVFPFAQAKKILDQYRRFTASAPEELNVWAVLRKAPPLPFLPESVHGREVVILPIFYAGKAAEGEKLIAPVRAFGDLCGEHLGA